MRFQIHVVRRRNHLGFDRTLEIRDFLRAFVNEQHHDIDIGMVRGDGVADLLENGGLAAAGRGDNQPARALANRRDEVNDARFEQVGSGFEVELFNRVNGGEVFKADGLGVFLKRHFVDLVNGLELRTRAAMRRLRRPGDVAAFAQETAPDGVGRDKNIGRLRMKMVGRPCAGNRSPSRKFPGSRNRNWTFYRRRCFLNRSYFVCSKAGINP